MVSRRLDTQQEPVICAVCARSLLRGEQVSEFSDGGSPRQVCDLCTARAMHFGWRRAGAEESQLTRQRGDRAKSIVGRWRARQVPTELELDGAPEVAAPLPPPMPAPAPLPQPEIPPADRRVQAIPTNAEQRAARAIEQFNLSEHTRTISGVARSLGAPAVSVHPSASSPVVDIVVAWELCWYSYSVDLQDGVAGVRLVARGDELAELEGIVLTSNARAGERGELTLATDGG